MGKPASVVGDGGDRAGGVFGEARSRSGGDASASAESSGRSVGRLVALGDRELVADTKVRSLWDF